MSDPGTNPFAKYAAAPAPNTNPFAKYAASPSGGVDTPEALGIPEDKGSFLGSVLHGASFGLSDEVGAGLSAPLEYGLDTVTGKKPSGATLGDYYDANLSNIRHGIENYGTEHPVLNVVGNVAGGMMDFDPEAATAALAKDLWPIVKQGAALGGAAGAASGFGDAQGGPENRLEGALVGGGMGAMVGGGTPVAVPYAASGLREAGGMISKAVAPWTSGLDDFIKTTAGDVLNSAAGPQGAHFGNVPLAGMKPTLGQITDNPGLKWLERSVQQGSPQGADVSANALAANNGAIHAAIGQLGNQTGDPAQAMSDALDNVYAARKAANQALWKQADVSNTGGVSGYQFNNFIKKYIADLPVADQAVIPPSIGSITDKMAAAKTQNLSDVQSVRSMIGGAAAAASRSGDPNTARVLGQLSDQVGTFIDMKAQNLGAKFPLYNAARADTRDMAQIYKMPPAVRQALAVDSYGADKIPVSATADHFINAKPGAAERLNSYLNAITVKAPDGTKSLDPAGAQAARDAFSQKFLNSVTNSGADSNGLSLISSAKMGNFLSNYSHVINSPLFDKSQRDLINRIGQAADMSQRVTNAGAKGGSDTYAKLSGKTFLDALIGPGASKIATTVGSGLGAIGGAVIGTHTEGPVAGLLAGYTGFRETGPLIRALYAAPRDKVIALVNQAISDPSLAQTLMTKASAKAALQIPGAQRRLIYSILGYEGSRPVADFISTQLNSSPTK